MISSIIIPVHNSHEFTLACIESIRVNTKDYEIIVVDNGSNLPFVPIPISFDQISIIRNSMNLGYSAAANQAIKKASGEVLVFINNDTIMTKGWLDNLLWHLKNGLDLVGPCTNSIAGPQQVKARYRYVDGVLDSLNRNELNEFAAIFHSENLHVVKPHYLLVLYCLALRREVVEKVGLFDESFTLGTFEDDDYCLRAIEAGFRLGIAMDTFIHHWGGVTHKSMNFDIKALFYKNWDIFKNKWSEQKYEDLKKRMSA